VARAAGDAIQVTYWLYRPALGWRRIDRLAGPAEVAAASDLTLSLEDDPALVPLESLPGRNHYRFTRAEEPPWRWRIASSAQLRERAGFRSGP
jgi:hypothetical protein